MKSRFKSQIELSKPYVNKLTYDFENVAWGEDYFEWYADDHYADTNAVAWILVHHSYCHDGWQSSIGRIYHGIVFRKGQPSRLRVSSTVAKVCCSWFSSQHVGVTGKGLCSPLECVGVIIGNITTCTRSAFQGWGRTPYPWSPRLRCIIQ